MVSKIAENHYRIDGKALNDHAQLGMQARVLPHHRNSQYEGLKLVGIRPGSLYRAIGVRSGDIIRRVNDVDITAPSKAMAIYHHLKNSPKMVLVIERRGHPVTLTIDIDRP